MNGERIGPLDCSTVGTSGGWSVGVVLGSEFGDWWELDEKILTSSEEDGGQRGGLRSDLIFHALLLS